MNKCKECKEKNHCAFYTEDEDDDMCVYEELVNIYEEKKEKNFSKKY